MSTPDDGTSSKVAFSLGGKKKKKTTSAKKVSAKDFGHDTAVSTQETEDISSYDPNEKKDTKAPLVIPLTQPANSLADRIKQKLENHNSNRDDGGIKQEGTASGISVKQEEVASGNGAVKQETTNGTAIKHEPVLSAPSRNGEPPAPVISSNDNVTTAMRQQQQQQQQQHASTVSIKDHLERELEALPDEADEDAYEKIPIDQFGAALLRGMGWNEADEQAKKESNQMFGNMPRPSRLGLGAIPKAPGNIDEQMPSVLTGKNKNKKKKLSVQQLQQQEEFERKRELQRKQDKQQTLQIGSIVYLLSSDVDDTNNNSSARQQRARIVQLSGVPGLNMVLVHLENEADPTPVKKGQLGPLVLRSDLEREPFVVPKPARVDNDRRRRDGDRRDRRRNRDRSRSRSPEEDRSRSRDRDRRRDRSRSPEEDRRRSTDKAGRHRDRSRSPSSRSPDRYRGRDDRRGDRKRDRRDRERSDNDDRDRKRRDHHRDRDDRKRRDDRNGKRRRRDGSGSDEESDRDRDKRRRKESQRDDRDRKRSNSDNDRGRNDSAGPLWMIPNIRVRVVTEKLGKRFFRQKGVIVDVTRRHGATLRMDMLEGGNHAVLEHVPERYLETALPKSGGNAIVLTGPSKWTKGKLLERNSKTSKGSIQVFEDMSILTLSLDDIAEWCGPLDDDLG